MRAALKDLPWLPAAAADSSPWNPLRGKLMDLNFTSVLATAWGCGLPAAQATFLFNGAGCPDSLSSLGQDWQNRSEL